MSQYDGERYYHRIPGLLVPRADDDKHETMHVNINRFIDTMPGLVDSMEESVAKDDLENRPDTLINTIEKLCSLLQDIYARGLEADAMRLLRFAKSDGMVDGARKNMPAFVMDLLSLSVALQKAQRFEGSDKKEEVSEIERHASIARDLSAVKILINDNEYESANKMITGLAMYNPEDEEIVKLLQLAIAKKNDELKAAVDALCAMYTESINQLAGTDLSKIILAVDDMPEILSFVNNALKSHYKVIAVPSGKAALKVLETQKPDLFILDIDMPEMDGFELAEKIRYMIRYKQTPLIFLTGNSSREHIAKAMAIGCNDFIVKPSNHDYLLTKVGKFLAE
ncbi:MAG: response regulator [Oscillospiraceae bacterium]|nr:response regulator [Oscillospiraceae bacterium]